MLRHRNKGRGAALVCLLALALCLLAGCGGTARAAITSLDQIGEPGTRIGVPGDIKEYDTLQQDYPEAEVLVYDNYPNAYEAVANGRLDAYIYSRFQMALAMESGTSGVRLLEENYSVNTVAAGLSPVSPIPALPERFNAFLSELRADGTLDDMYLRWVIRTEDTMPEIAPPAHSTYRLRVGTTGTVLPYSYYAGTELRGYDIELAYRFAAWLGAVDKGQMEAAYPLGYTENRAFFRVVLPQALPHFFPAYKGEIDRYCVQNDIPPRTKYRIRLAFEELVQQLLRPLLGQTGLHVTLEYEAAEERATVSVSYGGPRFDPAEGENELSYLLLKRSVEELSYTYEPERERPNTVSARIREKQE